MKEFYSTRNLLMKKLSVNCILIGGESRNFSCCVLLLRKKSENRETKSYPKFLSKTTSMFRIFNSGFLRSHVMDDWSIIGKETQNELLIDPKDARRIDF
jgi:hypothetical protein